MNPVSLLGHCAELLSQIERSRSTPADVLTSHYCRRRKYLGAKERRALSEIVFAALRCKNTAEYLVSSFAKHHQLPELPAAQASLVGALAAVAPQWARFDATPLLRSAAHTDICLKDTLEAFYRKQVGKELPNRWNDNLAVQLSSLATPDSTPASIALAACFPEWIVQHLRYYGWDTTAIVRLGHSLLTPAPLTLRLTGKNIDRTAVIEAWTQEGINAEPTQLSPVGIILDRRVNLLEHSLYRSGRIEVQDEGSQLVSYALSPDPQWHILDACAGAGGKTLHLADLQHDRGSIVASDVDPQRLRNLVRRLRRHQYRSIQVAMLPRERTRRFDQFDAVLLDVPCSGTGTLRRAPEIKWRLQPSQLERIIAKQERILETYAPYVRSGGVLLYATCSVLPGENHAVVERFLDRHQDFVPDPLAPAFSRHGINVQLAPNQWHLQLLPSVHNTDGFFIARMRRL